MMAKEPMDFDVVRDIAVALSGMEESNLHRSSFAESVWPVIGVSSASQISGAKLAHGAHRFRTARGFARRRPQALLHHAPPCRASQPARAVIRDRSPVLTRFVVHVLGVCHLSSKDAPRHWLGLVQRIAVGIPRRGKEKEGPQRWLLHDENQRKRRTMSSEHDRPTLFFCLFVRV